MDQELLRINTLAIALAGLVLLLTGIALFLFRDHITENLRFFIQLPPIGVSAYIFVFNLYRHYDGSLPDDLWSLAREIIYSTAIVAVVFGLFVLSMIFIINFIRR